MRFNKTLAAVAATLALGSAQAIVVSIDDFDAPGPGVQIGDLNGTTAGGAFLGGIATTPGNLAVSRDLFHVLTVGPAAVSTVANASVGVGTAPNFVESALNSLTGPGANATSTVTWNLNNAALNAAIAGSPNVSLFLSVLESNLGNNPVTNTTIQNRLGFELETTFNSNIFVPFEVVFLDTITVPMDLSFALSAGQINLLQGGSRLRVTMSGGTGHDLTIDTIGLSIPEPASLALAGLALLGAGIASRRRKA
jgi:hypothetical protein